MALFLISDNSSQTAMTGAPANVETEAMDEQRASESPGDADPDSPVSNRPFGVLTNPLKERGLSQEWYERAVREHGGTFSNCTVSLGVQSSGRRSSGGAA